MSSSIGARLLCYTLCVPARACERPPIRVYWHQEVMPMAYIDPSLMPLVNALPPEVQGALLQSSADIRTPSMLKAALRLLESYGRCCADE
ncbi:MAG: hypothetical protein KHX17_09150 [Clostridiales bacterium]|nr:hypothetical protein [Clostridiales bacterium]